MYYLWKGNEKERYGGTFMEHICNSLLYRYYTLVWEAKDKQYALDWIRLTHSPSTWRWLETYKTKWKIYNHSDGSMVKYIPRNQGLVFCAKSTSSVLFNWSENTSDGNISAQSITCGTGGRPQPGLGKCDMQQTSAKSCQVVWKVGIAKWSSSDCFTLLNQ